MTQTVTLVALALFIAVMLGIGLYSYHKTQTMEGFLLGGRKIGPWISAFAYATSYFSAVIFIGYAGMHGWNIGLASIWIGVGNAIFGCLLAWLLLARRTRRMTHALGATTMPEFFCERYQSVPMKVCAAAIIFLFLVPYAASVYKGLGALFSTVFPGASEALCMLIVAVLTAVYLVLGGYVATAITDFVQGIIMLVGVAAMVVAILARPEVGGLSAGIAKLAAIDPQLVNPWGGQSAGFLLINIALTSFGVWGLPQMIHKYYAIKNEKSIKQATVIATAFALLMGGGAYLVGSFGRLFVPATAAGAPDLADGYDGVVPALLMQVLSSSLLTNIILAVILLLLLSASMSTLAAIVLSSSSALAVDLIKVVQPRIAPRRQMALIRVLCLIFVALSFLFATLNISFIVNLMSFSWGVVAGAFIGPYLWGLYSRRVTRAGAWAGLLGGVLTVFVAAGVTTALQGFDAAKALAPQFGVAAMAVSLLAVPVVSLFTKPFGESHLQRVFAAPGDAPQPARKSS